MLDLLRGGGRIDGHGDAARRDDREVHGRPFLTRRRHERDGSAPFDPAIHESQRQRAGDAKELFPGRPFPGAAAKTSRSDVSRVLARRGLQQFEDVGGARGVHSASWYPTDGSTTKPEAPSMIMKFRFRTSP